MEAVGVWGVFNGEPIWNIVTGLFTPNFFDYLSKLIGIGFIISGIAFFRYVDKLPSDNIVENNII